MDEQYIKNLKFIKENIREGTYSILPKGEWEEFAKIYLGPAPNYFER